MNVLQGLLLRRECFIEIHVIKKTFIKRGVEIAKKGVKIVFS
jgi:hypothetical protein